MSTTRISSEELTILLDDPALDFLRVLWAAEHGLQRASKRLEKSVGITGPQRLVLRMVDRFPDLTPGELAGILLLDPSTITGILQRLCEKALIVRERDARDSRRVCLRVQHPAKFLTGPVTGSVEAAVMKTLNSLPDDHVTHAREVLTALASALHSCTASR